MKILSIIVTYNGMQWIDTCIQSLLNSEMSTDIFVVDNNSTDQTAAHIQANYKGVIFHPSAINLGFGKANNIGLQYAIAQHYEAVFLLNQDAWVESDTINKLLIVLKKYPQYGILSPFHLSYDGITTETYFNEYVLNHYTNNWLYDVQTNNVNEVYTSQFIHAACWLMPIQTINSVGGFDPLFFHYGEDNDYIQRLLHKNLAIGFVPHTNVYHYGTNEGLQNNAIQTRFLINQIVLQLKNPAASLLGALRLFFKQFIFLKKSSVANQALKKAYWFNLKRIIPIIRSRKAQTKLLAYLK